MRPADIEHLVVPGRPALRGNLLLTALKRPDLTANATHGAVRRVALDGGGEAAWTHGPRDSAPAISPDGRWVAFLRAGEGTGADGSPQLHVMPADGGEARRLTSLPLGAGEPVWAPDSRRIAFTARVPEAGRYGTPDADGETPEPAAEVPRRITRMDYRLDDVGFVRDRMQRLFVTDTTDTAEPAGLEPLTGAEFDAAHPVWTPDGTRVVFTAPPDWGAAESDFRDVCAISAEGGEPEVLVRAEGYSERPAFGADGTLFYFGQSFAEHHEATPTGLYAATPEFGAGPVKARRLTDAETVDCEAAAGPPVPRGDDVLVAVRHRGAVELRAVAVDAVEAPLADLAVVYADQAAVRSFTLDGSVLAAVVATPSTAGEVVLLGDGAPRVLTDYSQPLRDKGIRPMIELETTAPDGYPVHGWLVLPEGEGPHPVLRVVHGGPFTQQEWALFDEAQVYASAGYAVVVGNPRGSSGYGQAHGHAITHGFGTVDVDDVLALLDKALERPDLDASRVGIMGGSYGGFMTSWLAAHHGERFKAAWSERAVNAWDSMVGSSDIGYFFVDAYIGSSPEVQRDRSPLHHAEKIKIPFAVVHSEQDWRCPLEQAQRMFVALRRAGAPAEMLLFPGEGHELSRSGRPRHRVQRFEAVLEWWARHL
ncbi:Dipeptidyl aminopeptidase/acylaminoacyl peptidase [Amycolatopsis tolypomycina]|uniref:Dipeptidyl aminopeptidase/acylaminoacyl peptidase n=1 Tax=Amycolatopsis tolypomycina TaxID=208445 RepID=A0A1H4YR10_9PSEU|nr:S9 family peptidase [Amycolatopsis tolypomycina]SED20412.1 Dipeptidyl aminopeptidase/acylaminoacyl peptidase [Amycolatopsis tolypomycina]